MFPSNISNSSSSLSEEPTLSSVHDFVVFSNPLHHQLSTTATLPPLQLQKIKKKRNLPGNPDPDAEVIALSPKSLLATNRFICEICNKGFQRDQNLQLHRRGHNVPWKLKQRDSEEQVKKKVYVCPEPSCVHHHPSRALGDLTGIKKHFCRKHGEKKWKCGKCAKVYAVQSDWKAHSKTCGTREYRCDCGTIFPRKDSFITHRAFCDALAEESARMLLSNQVCVEGQGIVHAPPSNPQNHHLSSSTSLFPFPCLLPPQNPNPNSTPLDPLHLSYQNPSNYPATITSPLIHTYRQYYGELTAESVQIPTPPSSAHLSATALLQKAAMVESIKPSHSHMDQLIDIKEYDLGDWLLQKSDIQGQTRDFLGLNGSLDNSNDNGRVAAAQISINMGDLLHYTRGCIGSRNPSFAESDEVSVLKPLPVNVGYGSGTGVAGSKIWE